MQYKKGKIMPKTFCKKPGSMVGPNEFLDGLGRLMEMMRYGNELESPKGDYMTPTEKQKKIVKLRSEGFGIMRIAQEVNLSPNTVRKYIK
jgi:DNA-binding NarL/FixJ family response regulator